MTRLPGLLLCVAVVLFPAISAAQEVSPPGFTKAFLPNTIGPGSSTRLSFTIDNTASPQPVEALDFTDNLPAGLVVSAVPGVSTSCSDAIITAAAGGGSVALTNGRVGAFSSCTLAVNITASASATNTSGDLTSSAGNSGAATADLVVDTARPGFSKAFAPASIAVGQISTLTFTIDNSQGASALGNLSFVDNLPAGLLVAPVSNASTDCADLQPPSISAVAGSGSISVSLAGFLPNFPVLDASSTCTVSVDVVASFAGVLGNVSGNLLSSGIGGQSDSGIATAALEVRRDFLVKRFIDDPVTPGGTVTLEFSLQNTNRSLAATNIEFDDNLEAVLSGLAPSGPLPVSPCGAGSALNFAAGTLGLTAGSLAAAGSCVFGVTLSVPPGAAAGSYGNTTTAVTATIDGNPFAGNTASDVLVVSDAPVLTQVFSDDPVGAGGTVTLEYTISNPGDSALAAIAFSDELTDGSSSIPANPTSGFLPFPVSVGLPPSPDPPCGVGSSMTLVPAGTERQALAFSGGSLAAAGMPGDSCTFSVTVDIPVGFPGGSFANFTNTISAQLVDQANALVTGKGASDILVVAGAPRLRKDFTDDPTPAGGTATLQFTLQHDENEIGAATAIAFSDDLGAVFAGLETTGAPSTDCGGTVDILTDPAVIEFSGGSLAPGASCSIEVSVAVPADALPGRFTNTTSNLTALVGGVPATGNPAEAELTVAGLMLVKAFIEEPAIPGDTTTLRFTLDNSSGVADATAISFSDSLGGALSGLAAVAPLPVAPCGGTLVGTGTLSFSGGGVSAGNVCMFDVNVLVPPAAANGDYLNVTSVLQANIGGVPLALASASDVLSVSDQLLSIRKTFTGDPVSPGGTVTLELTIENLDLNRAASAIAFSDDLDAALPGLAVGMAGADDCGGTPAGAGTGLFSYSGGSLAAGGSCTVSVVLDVPAGPLSGNRFTNTTSTVTGTINGFPVSGPAASDDLQVVTMDLDKAFSGVGLPGQNVDLSFTITNLDASTGIIGLSFTDNLPAGLTAAAPLPANPCGAGSTLAGTDFLVFSGGNLAAGASCMFTVTLLVPAGTVPGAYPNTTSDLLSFGLFVSGPATDTLTVEAPPAFSKVFSPDQIPINGLSTLTFTVDNSAGSLAASALDFTDNLPAGSEVANPPQAGKTCTGGTLVAVAGSGVVGYSGGQVAAGASCTISVDITGTSVGMLVNTSGDLTSSSGNSGTASATLDVIDGAAPVVTAPPDILVEATALLTPLDLGTATAEDDVDGPLTPVADNTGPFPVGLTTVTWSATDTAGKTGTAEQEVTVQDTTPPVVILLGANPLVLIVGDLFSDPGATASDLVDGDLSGSIQVTGMVNTAVPGTTLLTYSATDTALNTGTAQRTVNVLPDTYRSFSGPLPSGATGTIAFSTADPNCTFAADPVFLDETLVTPAPPPEITFTDGVVSFSIINCAPGATVDVNIDYAQPVAPGALMWKAGTPWFSLPTVVAGNTISFSITDGELGDVDGLVDGNIEDPGGSGVRPAPPPVPVPVNGLLALLLLASLLMLGGRRAFLRR